MTMEISATGSEHPFDVRMALPKAASVARSLASTLSRYGSRASRGPMLAAACLAATICDGLVAVINLIGSHGQGHAPSLVRGLIEAMLDLELVCTKADYVRPLQLAAARGKLDLGERFLSQAGNLDLEQREVVRRELRKTKKTVEHLMGAGIKPLSIEQKFKRAPKASPLWFYYWYYSAWVHNDLRIVSQRHLRDGHLVLGETLSQKDVQETLIIACSVAIYVYEFIPVFLKATAEELRSQWEPLGRIVSELTNQSTPAR